MTDGPATLQIVPDADYYRTKASQFYRLARTSRVHDRDNLLELARELEAKAERMEEDRYRPEASIG
jgi:hypothetical protein